MNKSIDHTDHTDYTILLLLISGHSPEYLLDHNILDRDRLTALLAILEHHQQDVYNLLQFPPTDWDGMLQY